MTGPRGTKPKRAFSRSNIIVYGSLLLVSVYYLLPLWVMVVTSLKGMPEIRMGNIFAPPLEITFEPWVKAWSEACTGINCDGLSRGFFNSVKILVPSVILSIIVASVNGYALANWKFKGSDVFFTILILGAFVPYQIMIYPISISKFTDKLNKTTPENYLNSPNRIVQQKDQSQSRTQKYTTKYIDGAVVVRVINNLSVMVVIKAPISNHLNSRLKKELKISNYVGANKHSLNLSVMVVHANRMIPMSDSI